MALADMIKVKVLDLGDYPGFDITIRSLISKRGRGVFEATTVVLKMGKEPGMKEWRQPLQTGKDKELNSPLEPSEGIQAC